jgi:L-threo-3-deoxy-hexylosonate aldolase
MPKSLRLGIYVPTQVFFKGESGDLDHVIIAKHAVSMAQAGVAGIVTNGSNGEAVYLTREERLDVTQTTRKALDEAGFPDLPLIVGASEQSVRGTVRLCEDAATAGGDAVLILVPSVYKWAMDTSAIERYYTLVADASPLPVIIYNFPGAVSGIDLDSEILERLAIHPNIVGTKFTCGNVGKLARVAGVTHTVTEVSKSKACNGHGGHPYFAFAGIADFIAPSLAVGASGAIVGAANVFPRACVNVYNLAVQGKHEEAQEQQQKLARADWSLTKRAIPGFKAILERYQGYGGVPRQPMAALSREAADELCDEIDWMMKIEQGLR